MSDDDLFESRRRVPMITGWTLTALVAWLLFGIQEVLRGEDFALALSMFVFSILSVRNLRMLCRRPIESQRVVQAGLMLCGVRYVSFLHGVVQLYVLLWTVPLPVTAGTLARALVADIIWFKRILSGVIKIVDLGALVSNFRDGVGLREWVDSTRSSPGGRWVKRLDWVC
jgi:hypothetical protein